MKKRISAVCAALLLTASMLSACGKQVEDTPAEETTINIIQDGSEVVAEGDVTSATGFVDPGANVEFGGTETAPEIAETSVSVDQEEIADLIQGGVVTDKAPVLTEYNVDYKTRYGYNTLNDQEKALYAQILEAVKSVKTKVPVDDSVTDEMWIKVYGVLYMQETRAFLAHLRKGS